MRRVVARQRRNECNPLCPLSDRWLARQCPGAVGRSAGRRSAGSIPARYGNRQIALAGLSDEDHIARQQTSTSLDQRFGSNNCRGRSGMVVGAGSLERADVPATFTGEIRVIGSGSRCRSCRALFVGAADRGVERGRPLFMLRRSQAVKSSLNHDASTRTTPAHTMVAMSDDCMVTFRGIGRARSHA
jgi:hypothetical protein